jgi:hypothetical protein
MQARYFSGIESLINGKYWSAAANMSQSTTLDFAYRLTLFSTRECRDCFDSDAYSIASSWCC